MTGKVVEQAHVDYFREVNAHTQHVYGVPYMEVRDAAHGGTSDAMRTAMALKQSPEAFVLATGLANGLKPVGSMDGIDVATFNKYQLSIVNFVKSDDNKFGYELGGDGKAYLAEDNGLATLEPNFSKPNRKWSFKACFADDAELTEHNGRMVPTCQDSDFSAVAASMDIGDTVSRYLEHRASHNMSMTA